MSFGPFDITPQQIAALETRFTPFVNRLLEIEMLAHKVAGHLLSVTIGETTADGGVDAATREAPPGGDWIPAGTTAWQFKRSNLYPKACANELKDAEAAHEFLRDGGSYVMVIGMILNDEKIRQRHAKLVEKAVELGLIDNTQADKARIRVYDANSLARWASRFPSLVVSRLAGGPGGVAIDYDSWSAKRPYQSRWTPDASREAAITAIRESVKSQGAAEIRVQGLPGIGKTRLVLEALRGDDLRSLVAYVDDERSADSRLIEYIIEDGRAAILVVDECEPGRHIKLVGRLSAESTVKLVTIGAPGGVATSSPIVNVDVMPTESTDAFLRSAYPQFGAEIRRFVTDHGRGYMRWTIVLADRLRTAETAQAAELIERNDIEQFIAQLLPGGQDFFCSTILAILERVGWDGELRFQLEILARFAGVTVEDLDRVGRELEQRGLIVRQGRYRAITPHPLAVFLAAEAWRTEGQRIIPELLPVLDEQTALSLFVRIAQLGSFEPTAAVLPQLLTSQGPFSSLEKIETGGLSRLVIQLAIVLPDQLVVHLGEMIEGASIDELRELRTSRQDLIWALEKISWHRRTFEGAANSILRLALSESTTDRNAPATRAWLDLFGAILPGTAASPAQRLQYLTVIAADPDPNVRLLAIKAVGRTLVPHETIMVSGELQGGNLVEPRGVPKTYGELADYRRDAIQVLSMLQHDRDEAVSGSAQEMLIGTLEPLIADPFVGEALGDALVQLEGSALRRLREKAEHLIGLFERRRVSQDEIFITRTKALLDRLPPLSNLGEIEVLSHLRQWDLASGELQRRLDAAVGLLTSNDDKDSVLELLSDELPASWELGHALARTLGNKPDVFDRLLSVYSVNPGAIVGYLSGLTETGDDHAFDQFLDGERSDRLDLKSKLRVTISGPVTVHARERIMGGLPQLSVIDGISVLFGWQRNVSSDEGLALAANWSNRISSQADYNALIAWFGTWLFGRESMSADLQDHLWQLLARRSEYQDIAQQSWEWCQLAGRIVDRHGSDVARLILDLVDTGSMMIHPGQEESELLAGCARVFPGEVWTELSGRLAGGSWQIVMEVRGWLLGEIPAEIVIAWIGKDLGRARLAASIASPGGDEPTAIARYLLTEFGKDEQIRSSLWAQFVSGSWTGPESEHISSQIGRLAKWRQRPKEPLALRSWAGEMIQYLEERRQQALQLEAEDL